MDKFYIVEWVADELEPVFALFTDNDLADKYIKVKQFEMGTQIDFFKEEIDSPTCFLKSKEELFDDLTDSGAFEGEELEKVKNIVFGGVK
jgi:hypothetical protein